MLLYKYMIFPFFLLTLVAFKLMKPFFVNNNNHDNNNVKSTLERHSYGILRNRLK